MIVLPQIFIAIYRSFNRRYGNKTQLYKRYISRRHM